MLVSERGGTVVLRAVSSSFRISHFKVLVEDDPKYREFLESTLSLKVYYHLCPMKSLPYSTGEDWHLKNNDSV